MAPWQAGLPSPGSGAAGWRCPVAEAVAAPGTGRHADAGQSCRRRSGAGGWAAGRGRSGLLPAARASEPRDQPGAHKGTNPPSHGSARSGGPSHRAIPGARHSVLSPCREGSCWLRTALSAPRSALRVPAHDWFREILRAKPRGRAAPGPAALGAPLPSFPPCVFALPGARSLPVAATRTAGGVPWNKGAGPAATSGQDRGRGGAGPARTVLNCQRRKSRCRGRSGRRAVWPGRPRPWRLPGRVFARRIRPARRTVALAARLAVPPGSAISRASPIRRTGRPQDVPRLRLRPRRPDSPTAVPAFHRRTGPSRHPRRSKAAAGSVRPPRRGLGAEGAASA